MASSALLKAIAVTAQIHGRELTPDAVQVYASDLSEYPEDAVLAALARCRRELRGFPSIADILARIDDGRPGVEEAWAMLPQDESASVVWTDEMREAYGVAQRLMSDDMVAARMAFKEAYSKLVADARAQKRPTRWEPSLGHDKATHAPVLRHAAEKGWLTHEHVSALLPEPPPSRALQIEGPAEDLTQFDPREMVARIRNAISKGGEP